MIETRKILLVDDNFDVIELIEDCIKTEIPSVEVGCCSNGVEALKKLKTYNADL